MKNYYCPDCGTTWESEVPQACPSCGCPPDHVKEREGKLVSTVGHSKVYYSSESVIIGDKVWELGIKNGEYKRDTETHIFRANQIAYAEIEKEHSTAELIRIFLIGFVLGIAFVVLGYVLNDPYNSALSFFRTFGALIILATVILVIILSRKTILRIRDVQHKEVYGFSNLNKEVSKELLTAMRQCMLDN